MLHKMVVFLGIALLLLTGCHRTLSEPLSNDTNSGQGSIDSLLKVTTVGGVCPDANGGHQCHTEFLIERSGLYHMSGDLLRTGDGTLIRSELNGLLSEISKTDFAAIKSIPFTGVCAQASDGQEITYTFYLGATTEVIASCEVEIDTQSPLFEKIIEITTKYENP